MNEGHEKWQAIEYLNPKTDTLLKGKTKTKNSMGGSTLFVSFVPFFICKYKVEANLKALQLWRCTLTQIRCI